ncbi:MAG: hypothetical protein FWD17_16170, partial [Polyangiaceae bacterium]|nr:hypothetical protein [Polyangiaceae bacterium]
FVPTSAEGGPARAADERARTGDHTPHLLVRLARLAWVGPGLDKIETWLEQIEAAGGGAVASSAATTPVSHGD